MSFSRTLLAAGCLATSFFSTSDAWSHGGGLDSLGCHHNRKAGGYHCHRGSLAGQNFGSKPEAVRALQPTGEISGKPRIIDGDTIELAGERIRLHGIDAPEAAQTCKTKKGEAQCGKMATQNLLRLTQGQVVTCKGSDRDKYKRLIATCFVGPFNINEQMVLDGWALAYRKYSQEFVRAEEFAKARKEGMWRMEFEVPWDWRQQQKR